MKKLFALVAACGLGLATIGCSETPKPVRYASGRAHAVRTRPG